MTRAQTHEPASRVRPASGHAFGRVSGRAFVIAILTGGGALGGSACATALDLHEVDYTATGTPDGATAADAAAPDDAGPTRDTGVVRETKPDAGLLDEPCEVRGDGKLYCGNRENTPLRAAPALGAPTVDTLRTHFSIFLCWGPGDLHGGGNATWYYTNGDDQKRFGWLPAVALATAEAFDADPAARGLRRCDP